MNLWREAAGVVSEGPCWCFCQGGFLYIEDTLVKLLWVIATEWHDDRHLVG